MINIRIDGDNTVYMYNRRIGALSEQKVRKLLRSIDEMGALPNAVNKHVHYYEMDYTVCPKCRRKHIRVNARANGVEIGYCLYCSTQLYKFDGKVYSTIDHQCGVKVWHNLLYEEVTK